VRTVHDLIHDYQHVISELTLMMGSKGVFDVEVDGELLFSKHAIGRHANDGEVLGLFRERIGSGVPVYER
jgi:predicted Rdx family selenoprotein